jgi:hypothetical protein
MKPGEDVLKLNGYDDSTKNLKEINRGVFVLTGA